MIETHKLIRKLLILLSFSIFAISNVQAEQSHKHEKNSHDLKVGERLFNGLIKKVNEPAINCASCHNVYSLDTLNWNPSAFDIAKSTNELSTQEFKALIFEPLSKVSKKAHKGFELEDEQIKQIRSYLSKLAEQEKIEEKPIINKLIIFIISVLLLLFALVDIIVLHKIKYKILYPIIFLITTTCIGYILYTDSTALGRQQFYEPDQPIKFSHKVHAGDNRIECLYCHHTAEQSKSAGIPAQTLCLNCHAIVKEGTRSGKFEIAKIDKAVMDKKPVEWVRIHNLPDHVFFSHAQHVNVGKLACQECHGPIEEMDRVYQFNDLSMGWCISCHRTKKVQFTENNYYKSYQKFHDKIKEGKMDSVLVKDIGGQDCQKCHY